MVKRKDAGLAALCCSARLSCKADFVALVRLSQGGMAKVLACAPHHQLPAFRLRLPHSSGPPSVQPTTAMPLPTALSFVVGGPATDYLYLPVSSDSGLLLLWRKTPDGSVSIEPIHALLPVFADLMDVQSRQAQQAQIRHQFEDLFESVSAGILLISGDRSGAQVNAYAAGLLGGQAGYQSAADLSERMQRLRQRCDNCQELETSYAALMADVDFRAVLRWRLGPTTLEVDTHPVRGDGENGRIWLFRDVTAEELMIEQLRRQASLDPLTEIPNRRHFEERSAQILAAREVAGNSLAVVMLDIDHFKQINDSLGHAVGDLVLKEVARRARGALRPLDLLARFGGEEFVALLPVSDEDEARTMAEAMRSAIAERAITLADMVVPVTVSFGVAAGKSADRFSLELLLRRADEALYLAKRSGRNRVEVFSEETV